MNLRPLWEGEAFIEKPVTIAGLREAVSFLLYGTATRPPTSYGTKMASMTVDEKKKIFLDALEHWGIGPSGGAVVLTVLRAAFATMKTKLGVDDKHAFIDAIERSIKEEPNPISRGDGDCRAEESGPRCSTHCAVLRDKTYEFASLRLALRYPACRIRPGTIAMPQENRCHGTPAGPIRCWSR